MTHMAWVTKETRSDCLVHLNISAMGDWMNIYERNPVIHSLHWIVRLIWHKQLFKTTRKFTRQASKRRWLLFAVVWREPGVIIRCVFFAAGWREPASSAIIYNIVKVKVTCWPVDPLTRLTRWPIDLLTSSKKNPSRAIARSTYIHRRDVTRRPVWPIDPLTCRPVDLLEKEPLEGNCEVHVHTPLRCSAAKGAELDSAAAAAKQKAPFAAVWREAGAYII